VGGTLATFNIGPESFRPIYVNKKFWVEIMAFFPLIRHVPLRKRKQNEGDTQTIK
jgi:hypothetical protein